MGGGASIPGNAASSRDIASQVSELGEAYEPYANKIEADGIDRYSSHPDPPTPPLVSTILHHLPSSLLNSFQRLSSGSFLGRPPWLIR